VSDTTQAALQKAKAISRWEGEGGALGAATLDDGDMRILARLGAALLIEWAGVSEASRQAICKLASTLHAQRDADRIKQEIARFVYEREGQ
jgi:hypothetical protein